MWLTAKEAMGRDAGTEITGKDKGDTDQVEHVGHCKAIRFYSAQDGNL